MPTQIITRGESLTAIADAIRGKMGGPSIPTWDDYIAGLNNKAYTSDVKGIIEVEYETGKICTCTNGTITLTAPNTSGNVNFGVGFGEWTVSCNGENRTIKIEKYKEIKQIDSLIDPILNNNSWGKISQIAQAGTGDNFWDIGDCKEITLNGQIGDYLTLTNETLCVFILDFNHPINKTTLDNNIIFGGFKTAVFGGVDVALCDSGYGDYYISGTKYFNMNHYGSSGGNYCTNYGGWKGCDFRYDILGATSSQPSYYGNTYKQTTNIGYDAIDATITSPITNTLMAALPSDFKNILRLWTRYIDNKGNSSNVDANVTACIDAGISLLTEFEIFSARTYANTYEQNHQKQMAYYTAGNSKIKYKHNATSTTAFWWEPSAIYNHQHAFCSVDTNGNAGYSDTSAYSSGLAPAFKI